MNLQRLFYTIPLRLRSLFRRNQVEQDLDDELRYHLEQLIEANISKGMNPEEARNSALRSMEGIEQQKEKCRDMRRVSFIEDLVRDLRYAVRVLTKSPVFTLVAVLTLGLGIGANTAIFSVVNELLIRPLPYRDSDRITLLWEVSPEGRHQNSTSRFNFMRWRDQLQSFEGIAAFSDQRITLTGGGEPEEVSVQLATPELFQVLGINPILGSGLIRENAQPGAPPIVVLRYGIWQRRFGGDPDIIGSTINLNGANCTVTGVLPQGFEWHIRQRSGTGKPAEIWAILPMPNQGPALHGRFLSVVGRLKPDVPREQAEVELKTIHAQVTEDDPQHSKGYTAEVIPVRDQMVGNLRSPLWILLGAVGFVLLIACANVANLLLSRSAAREKEIALRSALGAHRSRIIRQLLTESLLLAFLGSLLGLGLAYFGIKALVAISPRDLSSLQNVSLNLTVLLWTLVISCLTGLIFGLAPALESARLDLNSSLKEGKGTQGYSSRSRRLRSVLVVSEIALALVLLVSAGLAIKSFSRMREIDTGFNPDKVLTMVARLPDRKYREDPQVITFFRQALERVRSLPGVENAGIVNYLPLYGGLGSATGFTVEGRPKLPPGEEPATNVRVCDPEYFDVIGIPFKRGRNFSTIEANEPRHVIIISESLAERYFPGEDPIGKRIDVSMFDNPNPTEIIGIVGDARYDSLTNQAEPTVYFSHGELTYQFMTLVIRTSGDPGAMAPAIRNELRELDPDQPVGDVRTMNQVMGETMSRARFNTLLLGLFAVLATVLAAVGIFGVMNYSVTLWTHEIGIRMALGASQKGVLFLILKQGLVLTLVGIGIGLAGAFALTRVMSSLLFGVAATDPATFSAIAVLLTAVSLLACYLPARRATRVDPLIALR